MRLCCAGQSHLASFVALAFALPIMSGFALVYDFVLVFDFAFVFAFVFAFDDVIVVLYRILADQMGSRARTTAS